jgi:sugar transferase EpsL
MDHFIKDVMDRAVAVIVLAMASPLLAIAAIAILLEDGRPVFFRQTRPGYKGKPFVIVKFRTMNNERDSSGRWKSDEVRLTKVGRILRRLSLDELPQFWNVLRGEMSIVGPRPLLMEYLQRYTSEQARRHAMKPGITGWAQVNGRNAITWEQRFVLDTWYVDNCSLWLDLRILARTVSLVLRRHGISQEGYATMPEFTGTCQPTRKET